MITIKTYKSDFEFKYQGNIELYVDDVFLTIKADSSIPSDSEYEIYVWYANIADKFWLEDIESIVGS